MVLMYIIIEFDYNDEKEHRQYNVFGPYARISSSTTHKPIDLRKHNGGTVVFLDKNLPPIKGSRGALWEKIIWGIRTDGVAEQFWLSQSALVSIKNTPDIPWI
jgi:hypothetical protein